MLPLLAGLALAALGGPLTLRVDYVHSGRAGQERFGLVAVVQEGPWPGRLDRTRDDSGPGPYFFEVKEAGTGSVLYSRNFASIYGEWESTSEAKQRDRAFRESLRFPEPAGRVSLVVHKRERGGGLREIWSVEVDPRDPAVDRAGPPPLHVWPVVKSGEPRDKVDLLLMGDGYTRAEMAKWHRDARRLAARLFAVSPFRERQSDFNVWAVDTPSEESGVSRPSDGIWRRTALRASYDAFGSERYVLAFDDQRLREAASAAPYEFVEVVVNDHKYGGGGIQNLYATVAADSVWAPYIFVHEFGHHFAGLADEYYTSPVEYEPAPPNPPEPWEPNVTADPHAAKWADLVTAGTALPTPWPKEEFETIEKEIQARRKAIREQKRQEAEMDALFREEQRRVRPLLDPVAGRVGAFEGAMYEARGYYRPQADCIMFTRDEVGFCAVCRRAIERVIDLYTRPPR